jgi:hypothetical protein
MNIGESQRYQTKEFRILAEFANHKLPGNHCGGFFARSA